MDLRKKEVADMLSVKPQTISRLVRNSEIPFYVINGEERFNREELEGWVVEKKGLPSCEVHSSSSPWQRFSLYRALHNGGVIVPSSTGKMAIIEEVVSFVANRLELDGDHIFRLLSEREALFPTIISDDVAVPHTREFLLDGLLDAIFLTYLDEPTDWGGGDRVSILFFLFACDDKRHLNLLSKIARIANGNGIKFIKQFPDKSKLLEFIRNWENSFR